MERKFDLTIIGGGPGGYVAAIRAAQVGLRVALVEEREMGGTCLNRGCIPTKALLQSAEIYDLVGRCDEFGIKASQGGFDYRRMSQRKTAIVRQLRSGVENLVRGSGGTILPGRARIVDDHSIEVSGRDGRILSTGKVIIATGSLPSRASIPGIDESKVLDSDQVLELAECPRRVVIIGGGVIGVEFATLFNLLGSKVTILESMDSLIAGLDLEISGLLRKSLESKGIDIFTGSRVTHIQSGSSVLCHFTIRDERLQAEGDIAIAATGRRPNTAGIGLEAAGIVTDGESIKVDERMETSVRGIFAIGDVTGTWLLAHAASAQGIVAAENAAGGNRIMDYSAVPLCIHTGPEIAMVGLTEEAARKKGIEVGIGRFPIGANGKCMIMGEKEGQAKIVTDRSTGEILGAHLMSPRATDMIGEICLAMKLESTTTEFAEAIHPHPTVSEILVEAAMDAEGRGLHRPSHKHGMPANGR